MNLPIFKRLRADQLNEGITVVHGIRSPAEEWRVGRRRALTACRVGARPLPLVNGGQQAHRTIGDGGHRHRRIAHRGSATCSAPIRPRFRRYGEETTSAPISEGYVPSEPTDKILYTSSASCGLRLMQPRCSRETAVGTAVDTDFTSEIQPHVPERVRGIAGRNLPTVHPVVLSIFPFVANLEVTFDRLGIPAQRDGKPSGIQPAQKHSQLLRRQIDLRPEGPRNHLQFRSWDQHIRILDPVDLLQQVGGNIVSLSNLRQCLVAPHRVRRFDEMLLGVDDSSGQRIKQIEQFPLLFGRQVLTLVENRQRAQRVVIFPFFDEGPGHLPCPLIGAHANLFARGPCGHVTRSHHHVLVNKRIALQSRVDRPVCRRIATVGQGW